MRRHLITTLLSSSSDAVVRGVEMWAESVQRLPGLPGIPGPDVTTVVDAAFDLAEQVLAAQRQLTKAVLRAVTP